MNIFIILSIIGVSIIVIFYLIKRAYDNKKKLITKRVYCGMPKWRTIET